MVEGQLADRLDAVDLDKPALADDRHAVAGAIDLIDDVRRQEDGPAVRLGLADDLEEGLLDERIEPGGRLVEDEQVGSMLERHDQPDLLLVALAVLAKLAAGIEIEPLDQALDVGALDAAAQVREVGDRVGPGQPVVQVEFAREVADPPMDRHRIDRGLDPEDFGPAAGRADEVEQDAHGRRLARAVGPEEAEDLALGDLEIEFGDAAMLAVRLGQLLRADDLGHARRAGDRSAASARSLSSRRCVSTRLASDARPSRTRMPVQRSNGSNVAAWMTLVPPATGSSCQLHSLSKPDAVTRSRKRESGRASRLSTRARSRNSPRRALADLVVAAAGHGGAAGPSRSSGNRAAVEAGSWSVAHTVRGLAWT